MVYLTRATPCRGTPHITCWFEEIPVEALVDSGAEASVISSRVFKILHASSYSEFAPDLTTFRGIGGKQQSQGMANFTLAIRETELTVPLHVVELGQANSILGMDLWLMSDNWNWLMAF